MPHLQSDELWKQILSVLGSLETQLSESLIDDPNPDWKDYLSYLRELQQQTVEHATIASMNDVQSVSASIRGLSRYSGEFYWKSDVDETLSKHLNKLAHLGVELLNVHNL